MDMRFHWLRDRETQEQFKFLWKPGKTNLEDYFTKHHPPAHHINVRSEFLTKVRDFAEIRIHTNAHGQTKPQPAQDTTSYKGVLDSKELHTIASILLARRAKNNLNSPITTDQ
jgi:hypothetical protein